MAEITLPSPRVTLSSSVMYAQTPRVTRNTITTNRMIEFRDRSLPDISRAIDLKSAADMSGHFLTVSLARCVCLLQALGRTVRGDRALVEDQNTIHELQKGIAMGHDNQGAIFQPELEPVQ